MTTKIHRRLSPVAVAEVGGIEKTPDARKPRMPRYSEGMKTGLSVFQFLSSLFQANELLPRSRKMTDAEIERKIVNEFPEQPISEHLSLRPRKYTVNWYRNRYNGGRFSSGQVPCLEIDQRWRGKCPKSIVTTIKQGLRRGELPISPRADSRHGV